MSISVQDIKKLWGAAAGRCSRPGCDEECIRFLGSNPTVIGEMAHIIAKSPEGPRGVSGGGEDTYENLILLCPTHHTEIDKSQGNFTPEVLIDWKKRHEAEVSSAFNSPVFSTESEIGKYISHLLIENKAVWAAYGPESKEAQSNPLSNLWTIWDLRKLDTVVPNNRRIINAIKRNSGLFGRKEYEVACAFVEHAEGFEKNCYRRTEGVPRFPKEFEEVIKGYVQV